MLGTGGPVHAYEIQWNCRGHVT